MSDKEGLLPEDVMPPEYSILDKRGDGDEMVTTVIIDGVLEEFTIPTYVFRAAKKLRSSN